MTKEQALAKLVIAVRNSDISSHKANIREHNALQDAFNVLGVSSGGYWRCIVEEGGKQ